MGYFPASWRWRNTVWSLIKTQLLQTASTNQSVESIMSPQQEVPVKPQFNSALEISGKRDVKSRGASNKKSRFHGNIIAYDPVSYEEEQEEVVQDQNAGMLGYQGNHLAEDGESLNNGSFIATIAGLYSANSRYENCRDSDDECDYWVDSVERDLVDEVEELNDFDDDDDDGDRDGDITAHTDEINQMSYSPNPAGRRTRSHIPPVLRPIENLAQWEAVKVKGTGLNIPPVLRPVENLAQWKALKAMGSRSRIPPVLRPVENLAQWKALKAKGSRSRIPPVLRPVKNLAQWNALKTKGKRSHVPPVLRPVENLAQWNALKAEDTCSHIPPVLRPVENLDQWNALKAEDTRSRIPPVLRPVENLAQWNALKAEDTRSRIPPVLRPVENLAQWNALKAEDTRSRIPPVLRPVENLTQWKALKAEGTRDISSKQRKKRAKGPTQEMLVVAGLSTWSVSPETASKCSSEGNSRHQ
ncbi:hypothetical protein MLD38_038319 [Melastoma candidum]|uniref:Uncharacterized protein n=1 Tax=Melastoma candidum TaxID=119954 RepID=A0ACB9KZ68_9MYRT|nr:hypothetical protein MLD38_038319 [Melastoma candidum]